jgi:hypothetical protein
MLMEELQALAAKVAPTGKAIRVVLEGGAGADELQVADNGAVVSGLVVYKVPAGKVWPDLRTVRAGIGAMM